MGGFWTERKYWQFGDHFTPGKKKHKICSIMLNESVRLSGVCCLPLFPVLGRNIIERSPIIFGKDNEDIMATIATQICCSLVAKYYVFHFFINTLGGRNPASQLIW